MDRTKIEHYVPISYLKRFATPSNSEQLWVFDKSTRASFQTNIKNVACEKGFYDIPDEPASPQSTEKILSVLEKYFDKIIDLVITNIKANSQLVPEYKVPLARLLYTQTVRTRRTRNKILDAANSMDKALHDIADGIGVPNDKGVKFPEPLKADKLPIVQADMIFSSYLEKGVKFFTDEYVWNIGINNKRMPLYTSDNPVVMDRKSGGLPYILSEIAFPLTPEYILLLGHKSFLGKAGIRNAEEIDCRLVPMRSETIKYYNSLQVFQCHRHIYYSRKSFQTVRQICNEYPEWCNPERDRADNLIYQNETNPLDNIIVVREPLRPDNFTPSPYIRIKNSADKYKLLK